MRIVELIQVVRHVVTLFRNLFALSRRLPSERDFVLYSTPEIGDCCRARIGKKDDTTNAF